MGKAYYAIIPADVRYDKELTANAKLLYGEITALCNEKGYCWASNIYFAELYNVSKETASRWISSLEKAGHIKTQLIYSEGTKSVKERRIYLPHIPIDKIVPIDKNINTPRQNNQDPIDEIVNTPIDKKLKDNNTSFNNTFNNTVEVVVEEKVESKTKIKDKKKKEKTTATTSTNIKDIKIAFEENGFGTMSEIVKEELVSLVVDYSAEWVLDAIKESIDCNVKNLKYTKAILKRWKSEGRKSNKGKHKSLSTTSKRTRFHNLEQRTDNYSGKQMEDVATRIRREHLEKRKSERVSLMGGKL